jgi:hypothetical protein
MFLKIRRRLSYTNVMMTLALVFAMSSGAYAASRYVITSAKQIKPSVLKQLQGKQGSTGPAGATGSTGPAGATGSTGPAGATGSTGPAGATGKTGTEGKEGKSGFTATLPSGETEKGQWAFYQENVTANQGVETAVSFTIPLASRAKKSHFIAVKEGEGEEKENPAITNKECKGTFAEPQAAKGNFCVFASTEQNLKEVIINQKKIYITNGESNDFELGAGLTGAIFLSESEGAGTISAIGSWAVTAE